MHFHHRQKPRFWDRLYLSNDWVITDAYDGNGNTLWTTNAGTGTGPYSFDVENRLTNFGTAIFGYNGDGTRVLKAVGTTTNFCLVDDRNPTGYPQVLEEWTGSGGAPTLTRYYNYGLSLISQQDTALYYFVPDVHGSARLLLTSTGSVANALAYDAYGNLIASNSAPQTVYLYCGEQWDLDLEMYYLRARYYSPGTGRFWTMDTFEGDQEDPLTLHKYLYCRADPVNGADPSGHGEFEVAVEIDFMLQGMGGPFVSAPAAVAPATGTCGPDVTEALKNTLNDVQQTFTAAPPVVKARMGIDVPLAMGDGWDIGPLKKLGGGGAVASEFGGNAVLGTGPGALTVQLVTGGKANVYYGGSVNYVLWGKVFRLLHDTLRNPLTGAYNPKFSESAAVADAWLYKSGFNQDFGMTKTEAIAFVKYGYSGTDPSSTALSIPTNPKNVATPKMGRFPWKWLDLRNDEE